MFETATFLQRHTVSCSTSLLSAAPSFLLSSQSLSLSLCLSLSRRLPPSLLPWGQFTKYFIGGYRKWRRWWVQGCILLYSRVLWPPYCPSLSPSGQQKMLQRRSVPPGNLLASFLPVSSASRHQPVVTNDLSHTHTHTHIRVVRE